MAVLVGKKLTEQTSGATITPSFSGLDIQAGDWIGICLTNDHPSGTTPSIAPPAGWAKVDTAFTVSGGIEHGWIYKLAASSAEAAPVITVNNDDCMALVEVWRYVDQTTPIDCVATRADWNLTSTATCNVASASAGAVVIYSLGADGAHRMRFKLSDAVCDDRRYSSGTAIAHLVGHRQIESAGNFPAIVAYGRDAAEGGTFCAFALRNASGGAKQPDVRVTSQELAWYGAFGATHDGISWLAPDQFAGTGVNIGGFAVSAITPSAINTVAETTAANWGTATQLTTSDTTADILMGGCHTITSANLADCVASIEWRVNIASTSTRAGTAGVLIGFSDGTNWSVYQIATKEYSWDSADIHAALVAIGSGKATTFATSGTLNTGAVTKVGYFWHKATANSGDALVLRNLTAISKVTLTGGGALRPARPTDISTALGAMGHIELARLQSTKQVQVRHNVQIGDGTNATYYDHTAFSVEFPGRYSTTQMENWQMYWNATANAVEIRVKGKASDTLYDRAGVFASDLEQNFVMDSATSASATYLQTGSSVVNFAYTGDTNAPVTGRTFSGCDTVAFEGEDVTNCTITGTTSTNAAASFSASGATMDSCTIDGTGAAYALELGTSVTSITLADCTLTAGSTDKILVKFPDTTVAATAMVSGTIYEVKTKGTTTWTSFGATSAAVTFQDTGDTVTYNSHGMENGDVVYFSAITSTTGISVDTVYYVVNKAANTFQVAATRGGAALPLTTDGSGTVVVGKFEATGVGTGTGDAYSGVKITVSGTTSLAAGDVTKDTGCTNTPVKIAAPQPTLSATGLANTRYLLWNRTTSAELDNTFVIGTSYSKVISSGASSGDVLDLYAFKEGYAESVATLIYSGGDAAFAVDQSVDTSIDYYRTQESITDYTTLTEYNFYAPDIYIQADDADGENKLARLFIFYNGVLTTEDGARYMRGGITFNSPFDVVINRSVRAIAVDNVSTSFGLHFTDETSIRVTTDDGSSWIAPPSEPGSIRYAFGVSPGQIETGVSGVTAQDIADIASAAATAVTTDSKTLTVPKFLGLK